MKLRSLLFVPGDRPDRMDKALLSGADALIIDLEDSVVLANKEQARSATAAFLSRTRHLPIFVRVNPLNSGMTDADLSAILVACPDGLFLPKAEGASTVLQLASKTKLPIIPIATETAAAVFALGSYQDVSDHLCGLTWGAEDLPSSIGAHTSREADGRYTAPYETVRSLTLFAAHAARTPAIETVYPDIHDLAGLKNYAKRGYRDGFTGMMAIHPSQVVVINAAFSPTEAQIADAQSIVEASDSCPGIGAFQLNGRMIDAPHINAARKLLARQ